MKKDGANAELRRLMSEHVASRVGVSGVDRYKLTTAIGELHQGSINGTDKFAGILPVGPHVTSLDCARAFGDDGRLKWLGRPLNWTRQPGQQAIFKSTDGR